MLYVLYDSKNDDSFILCTSCLNIIKIKNYVYYSFIIIVVINVHRNIIFIIVIFTLHEVNTRLL